MVAVKPQRGCSVSRPVGSAERTGLAVVRAQQEGSEQRMRDLIWLKVFPRGQTLKTAQIPST